MSSKIINGVECHSVEDIFCSMDEANTGTSFSHSDMSSLANESFNSKQLLEFITDPKKVSASYSSNEVLGTLEGIFFMPGGFSLNNRWYSEALWENTVSNAEVITKLDSGMLGMFEHPNATSIETKDGNHTAAHYKNSGIVTKSLKIVESNGKKYGYGKAYILNTPIGNILNVMMKAKDENGKNLIKLAVSSRAFARVSGKTKEGAEIIDENNYYLSTFDVVVSPGIAQAVPVYKSLAESFVKNICESNMSSPECKCKLKSLADELGLVNLV